GRVTGVPGSWWGAGRRPRSRAPSGAGSASRSSPSARPTARRGSPRPPSEVPDVPTDFGFRFSTYLALGLACATLGYAEVGYLPSVPAFTVVVLGMMVVAFRRDGRNEISLATANRVGLVIGIAVIAYLAFQFFRPGESLLDRMPLPAGLLPYL